MDYYDQQEKQVNLNNIRLKVKINSLSAEAKIIRRAENKYKHARYNKRDDKLGNYYSLQLKEHRKQTVRIEQRASLIAHGYLRGKSYAEVEPNAYRNARWDRVAVIVKSFGTAEQAAGLAAWGHAAQGIMAENAIQALNKAHERMLKKEKRGPRVHRTREQWEQMQADLEGRRLAGVTPGEVGVLP